jgi:hypothetical protein
MQHNESDYCKYIFNFNWRKVMALPIKPTPTLKGKAAQKFLQRMKEVDNQPRKIRLVEPNVSMASKKLKSEQSC